MPRKPLRRRVGPRDREKKHQREQQKHQRYARPAARNQAVHGALPFEPRRGRFLYHLGGDGVRAPVNRRHQRVVPCIFVITRLPQSLALQPSLPQRRFRQAALGADARGKGHIPLQQAQGDIALVPRARAHMGGYRVHRARDGRGILDIRRAARRGAIPRAAQQLPHAPVAARACTHHGHAQQRFQARQIERNVVALRFIQQIDAHHTALAHFQRLQGEVQIAREARSVAYHHNHVHPFE